MKDLEQIDALMAKALKHLEEDYYKCWGCDQENETVISIDLGGDVGYYCSDCRAEMENEKSSQ